MVSNGDRSSVVDLADVLLQHRQPGMRRQVIAEPLRVEDGDVVARPRQHRLRQLRADVAAAAGDEDVHERRPGPCTFRY